MKRRWSVSRAGRVLSKEVMLSRAWTKWSSQERRVCASSQGPLGCREEPGLGSWGREGADGTGVDRPPALGPAPAAKLVICSNPGACSRACAVRRHAAPALVPTGRGWGGGRRGTSAFHYI